MDSLRHFPLGARLPESPHSVISSLPTMADVRGYEEQEPRVIDTLKSGYPRFVVHEFIRRLIDYYIKREGLANRAAVLIPNRRAADDLLAWLGQGFEKLEVEEALYLVFCEAWDEGRSHQLRKFVQHVGCGISSRQAEDLLISHGLLSARFEEPSFEGNAMSQVEQDLAGLIGCRGSDILVCASGMNAFYAGFRAVQEFNLTRGRSVWLQLGWLYLDSGKILEHQLLEGESLECIYDISDMDMVIRRIQALGKSLGAVVIECPSNPLVEVGDLNRIAAAVRGQGGVMMVDPTIASVYNVNILHHADMLVTSLTKYASIEGDVMIGALAVNPDSPFYGDLILRTSGYHQPAYSRDLSRLAYEMQIAPDVLERMNVNARRLTSFLKGHSAVSKVHVAHGSKYAGEIAKSEGSAGVVIRIELSGSMEKFYDAVKVMKGPSFGARFTLLCPFMYLAHYDLVTSDEGRAFLTSVGINPELIRISVGEEDYGDIEAVFCEALDVSIS